MVSLDDLRNLMMYKKPFFLPIDMKNKRKGSAIVLMSPNYKTSIDMIRNTPYIINKNWFQSYYLEKDITRYIQNESVYIPEDKGEYLLETPLSTKERNDLPDSEFGIPSQRKYPLNDKEHIKQAIRFFNHVEEQYEKQLARNIIDAIDNKFTEEEISKISVSEKNRFYPYWIKSSLYKKYVKPIKESFLIEFSNIDEEDYTDSDKQYYLEFVSDALRRADKKLVKKGKFVFSGYDKDIREVEKYFSEDLSRAIFKRLNLSYDGKINVVVTSDITIDEEITDNSFVIYTKSAFKGLGYRFEYEDYIDFMAQLFAIYTIKPMNGKGPRILDNLAEPLAILLAEIIDKKTIDKGPTERDGFTNERVWNYIIEKYGINEAKNVLKFNDIQRFVNYGNEYYKAYTESDLLVDEDTHTYISLTEDGSTVPESLIRLQKLGDRLKRKIRAATVYKLNKIVRDATRGTNGIERKNRELTGLEKMQTGQIVNIPQVGGTPTSGGEESTAECTLTQLKIWSNGDYVQEGNIVYLFEDNTSYDFLLRKSMYKDRFKTNKQVLDAYKKVKADCPEIKFTFADINRYQGRNLFVDLSYYNESFFKNINNFNVEDKKNDVKKYKIYAVLMSRLLGNVDLTSDYKKKTIFIPVLPWRHNNSNRMWMYREDINPISIIYNYIKNDRKSLEALFGDNDVVFLGAKNYFKVNFKEANYFNDAKDQVKFLTLIRRMIALGYTSPADPDPEEDNVQNSPTGIAMDIVDKIEKSSNTSIDNLSGLEKCKKVSNIYSDNDNKPIPVSGNIAANDVAVKKVVSKNDKDLGTVKKVNTVVTVKSSDGTDKAVKVETLEKKVSKDEATKDTKQTAYSKAVNDTTEEEKKDAIVDKVADAANKSVDTDDALDKLNDEEFKTMIAELQNDNENNARVDKARASKIIQTEDEFHEKEVNGKTVKEMLATDPAANKIPETDLHIASINDGWSHMTFMNFDKNYDPNTDIIKMLDSMQNWTFPIAVKNLTIKDNSTSEDILDLWTIECVDYKNTKFTLKLDVPRFINGSNFLKLRGNEKNIFIQSTLIPIIKTGLDECQIIGVGGYNKVFVRRYGARKGQSLPATNRLMKTLNRLIKNDDKSVKVVAGDNTKVCTKYELPMDYTDIASITDTIESKSYKFYFNQDALRTEYEVDDTKGIPIGTAKVSDGTKNAKEVIIYYSEKEKKEYPSVAEYIANLLCIDSPEFSKIYNNIVVSGSKYTYSKASILSTDIPVVIICGYLEGLIPTLKKARIEYKFVQKIDKEIRYSSTEDYIKFKDGYLVYKVTYSSSLLLNGFKECDTESYSIKEINGKRMYYEFLENYGGSLKSDGLENSYDCLIDPISKEILDLYKLPTDYISVMIHANNLLADNKYVKHTDQSGRRFRRKELIAGYFYKVLTTSYQEYANSIRHNRKNVKMTAKQSAIIDTILSKDPSTSDLSVNNVINDVECANTVSNKGLVGMNSDRAYSVGTRTYDESMINVLGMDTGFSGNVGINRQATIDANIETERGLIKTGEGSTDSMSTTKALTITEAMTPLGCTHDDPQRTLMTYLQTSKHMIRTMDHDPTLVTTGADEAIPYLTSDIFAFKAKDNGTVVELVQEGIGKQNYMIIEYKDGTHDYVDLSETIKKNSDGGYFVPMQLTTDLKEGSRVKAGQVVAYDKLSFSKTLGESGNLAASVGTLAKVAIINTDEGFEDSAAVTANFAKRLGTEIIMHVEAVVDKGCNLFINKNVGDKVMEGDTLFAYQRDFEDDVANTLLKNLSMDSEELIDLGKTPVKTKYTGTVAGIEVYRTVDIEEMSESLQAFCKKYDSNINKTKRIYDKYDIDTATLPPTKKVDPIGKAKGLDEAIKIIYYIKFIDNLSAGDKIVFYSANKGVIKYIIPEGQEPYTEFRPNEKIDSFMSLSSISGRMTGSIPLFGATSKLMVELDRSVKDLAGIPYDESKL